MKGKRAERRRFVRFNFDTNIKFRFFDNMDKNIKGKAKNISAEGLCIVAHKGVPVNKDVELDMALPGKKRPVKVHGNVMWTQRVKGADRNAPDRFEAGIKLYTMDRDDENTLLKYYCERMIDSLSQYLQH